MAGTRNQIVIEAPLDDVWNITNDVPNWPDLFSEYAEANVLEQEGSAILFQLVMHPDENGIVWSWTSQRILDRDHNTVRARRVETGPFEFMHIEWTYEPVGEHATRMIWTQKFHMRPTAPVNDVQMTNRINTNSVIQMELIKQRVEARVGALVG